MNIEQERRDFELWHDRKFGKKPLRQINSDRYAYESHQSRWEAFQAGRAAPQEQDREDSEFQVLIRGELQAQTWGPRAQAWAEIQRYAAQYAEEGPVEVWEVTYRRIEGEGK